MIYSDNTPRLEKIELTSKPTIVITERLKRQIDFLHSVVKQNEWSGELITREEGSINNMDNWRIICEDIFLCDIGIVGYTEYEVDKGGFKAPDIVQMYDSFPDLLEGKLKNHHIHTHHNMGAFFSPTDWKQLEDRAIISNYFMMLIVDFKEDYKAKVAFKATIAGDKKRKLKFANNIDGFKDITLNDTKEKDVLVVVDCNIEWESPEIHLPEGFEERYRSVKAAIAEEEKKKSTHPYTNGVSPSKHYDYDKLTNQTYSKYSQPAFDWEENSYKSDNHNKEKKISEMTDREWKNYADISSFCDTDACILLNSVINQSYDKDTSSPISKLLAKHNTLKSHEIESYANGFITAAKESFDTIYIGCDNDDLADLIEEILSYLERFKTNRLINALYDKFSELQVSIDNPSNGIYE